MKSRCNIKLIYSLDVKDLKEFLEIWKISLKGGLNFKTALKNFFSGSILQLLRRCTIMTCSGNEVSQTIPAKTMEFIRWKHVEK